jgi:hypothetical protein
MADASAVLPPVAETPAIAVGEAPANERSDPLLDLFKCSICLSIMLDPASLLCGHSGCLKCLRQSFKQGCRHCPLCKAPIEAGVAKSLHVSITLSVQSYCFDSSFPSIVLNSLKRIGTRAK